MVAHGNDHLPKWVQNALDTLQTEGFAPPEDAKILMASLIAAAQGKLPVEHGLLLLKEVEPSIASPRALAELYDKLITRRDPTSSSLRKASGAFYTPPR
jgi:hypothetical protein